MLCCGVSSQKKCGRSLDIFQFQMNRLAPHKKRGSQGDATPRTPDPSDSPGGSSDHQQTSGAESAATDDGYAKDVNDAVFDHTLALRKSAPRGGTWKFSPDNLSVEIPLGPVTLFSDKSVSIHDTQFIVWTFKVEPVKITRSDRIRRERYCFGLVPENQLGNPGFLLIEEDNPCRMEGGFQCRASCTP